MKKHLLMAVTAFALFGLAAGAASAETAANANNTVDVEQVTWAEHVAPVLFENCASCHRPGQVAPMSLLSYQEARPWAKSIRKVTHERSMPPWFANPAHGQFVEDPSLTDEQIALIGKWVEAGAPAGDLSLAPEPPTFESEWKIGTPDAVFTMEPFQVTDEMEDHYQWLKIDNPLDRDAWIKSFEVRPSFMEAAHHNLTYIAPEGMELEDVEGPGRIDMTFVGGWAPGVAPVHFEEGYGKLLPANSSIFFQMHYHKTPGPDTGGIDQTSVAVEFWDEQPENEVTTMWIMDPALSIPPGESNYTSSSYFEFEHEARVFFFTPHMHLRGKSMKFTAEYPDGSKEVLLDVPQYDFNWQLSYTPVEPLVVPAGTKIHLDAVFDNSADNPANPDPTIEVTWGEATTDEMMIGFMDYHYTGGQDMPTFGVPEEMQQRFEAFQRFREAQKQAEAQQKQGSD